MPMGNGWVGRKIMKIQLFITMLALASAAGKPTVAGAIARMIPKKTLAFKILQLNKI